MSTAILARSSGFDAVPADLRIPAPPRARRVAARRDSWWREAMFASLLGLTASWAAGEIALWLAGA